MLTVRRANDRGHFDHGWLNTSHTFSFGQYHDPAHMGFGPLRVINEDRVQPHKGFGEHGHRDMEIISYVLAGTLEHGDSLGSKGTLHHGDVQVMSAGSGIRHYEKNGSGEEAHFYQIWIEPNAEGVTPRYDQKRFPIADEPGRLHLIASPDGADGSLPIHQDARMLAGLLGKGQEVSVDLPEGRRAWVQIARGTVRVNGERLDAGDGAAVQGEPEVTITASGDAEVLVFDLA